MGKNYVENSLKRFLKRKVKITLGFVVAFMISGTVGFAEETQNWEYFLLNKTLENHFCDGICPEDVEFNPEGEILDLSNDELRIDSSIYHNHGNITISDKEKSIILSGNNPELYNYGEIISNDDRLIHIAENTLGAKIYNYGKIKSSRHYLLNAIDCQNKVELYNYGTMIQIPSGVPLNFLSGNKDTICYNYGTIISLSNLINAVQTNIFLREDGYKIINNGYINVHKIMAQLAEEEKLFNNGVILTENFTNAGIGSTLPTENTVNNKGIFIIENDLKVADWKAFSNNQGAILQKQNDGTYKLLNTDTLESNKENDVIIAHGVVKDMSNETVMNKDTIKTNGKEVDNLFINNQELSLDLGEKISNKTITVMSQKEGNVILDNSDDTDNMTGDENLTLDNTTIVGYFEKDGTLLKVDGSLTLENGSIVNAIAARDENGNILPKNVYAVDVNGELTYNNGQVYGNIKGGEKSVINVKGGSDINILTNEISTKGTVNLNDGNWTKGETGKITFTDIGEHSAVNVAGNLVGDILDNTSTTLDKIIDIDENLDLTDKGKIELNVDKIRFNLGSDLDITGLGESFEIQGNENIVLGDKEKANALDKIDTSVIFKKEITKDGDVKLVVKTAEEMGIYDPAKQKEYEQLVINFKDHYELINSGSIEEILNELEVIDKVMALMGTSGVKITRDIAGAFTDSVNEFDKKANKGEWLTNAKYIGSDMEYDGTSTVNGYESDINSMVGMAEYGISDNTSLGFALGGGDTDIDLKELNGKSTSLDGHNYYAGVYAKHSVNGFDMTGSFGYTISDLDVENGGSADSEAFTLAGYIKRDINLTDTIKLQPNVAFAYDYIKQDTAEMGKGMSINSGDYHIFEADMGMNIVKEIAFEKGNLELKAGIKYSITNINRNKEITGKYYAADVNLGSPEIDDKKGTAHIGFDYEHETGFGVNGKYETMWSDSGDDSRITAGVSYRF